MKSRIIKLLSLVFALVFLYSGWQVLRICSEYRTAAKQYETLEQYVSVPAPPSPSEAVPAQTETADENTHEEETIPKEENIQKEETPESEAPPWPQVDFDSLSDINPDLVGWLVIEGTTINYPVVQGADNDFYLTHQFDRKYNRLGCLFLDAANDASFLQFNQIVYGHHPKNRSMFHDLANYKDQAFFDAHSTGWLITPSAVYQLQFFSGYVSDVYADAWETKFTEADYPAWLRECKEKSLFSSDVDLSADSRVLTLSTCSYEFKNARFVLHAVLQRQNINAETS